MSSRNTRVLSNFLAALVMFAAAVSSSALERQPNADYHTRRVALAEKMAGGVAIVFAGVESEGPDATYGFRQDNSFYYLSGWTEPGAALVIVSQMTGKDSTPGRPYSEILFLPAHNVTQEKWTGLKLAADSPKIASITGFDRVASLDQMPAEITRIFGSGGASVYVDNPPEGQSSPGSNALQWLHRTNTFPIRTATHDIKPLLAQLRVAERSRRNRIDPPRDRRIDRLPHGRATDDQDGP